MLGPAGARRLLLPARAVGAVAAAVAGAGAVLGAVAVADAAAGFPVGAVAAALSALSCGSCALSVRLFVGPSACFFVSLPYCPSVRLSVCPSVRLSVCPSVSLSVCQSVRLFVGSFVRLLVCPSGRGKVRLLSLSDRSMQLRTSRLQFVVWEGLASPTPVPSLVWCRQYSPL